MKKIIIVFLLLVVVVGFIGWQVFQLKRQVDNSNNLAATIPGVISWFETSLQSKITSTATTATLVTGTDKRGTTISGTFGFIFDEGTTSEEAVICTASGTALTGCTRGIDPQDGKTEVTALQYEHRRGASVKLTNYPILGILKRIANGQESFPNTIYYPSAFSMTTASGSAIVHKSYVDSVVTGGAADANLTTKGLSELATVAQINAGTGMGDDTTARLFVNPSYLASSNYASYLPSSTQKLALAGSAGTPSGTNLYITQDDVSSSSFSDASDKVIRSDGDSLPSGLWVDISRFNIAASAQGDILYRGASAYTRLGIGSAGNILVVNSAGTAPYWQTASSSVAFGVTTFSTTSLASGSTTFIPKYIEFTVYCGAGNVFPMSQGVVNNNLTYAYVAATNAGVNSSGTSAAYVCNDGAGNHTGTVRNISSTGFTIVNTMTTSPGDVSVLWKAIK